MTIYNKPVESSLNSMKIFFGMTEEGVRKLAARAVQPDAASIIFGDYTKWASSLMYYPIDLVEDSRADGNIALNAVATDIPISQLQWDKGYLNGFDLGEIKYEPIRDSKFEYAEYEPYASASIYLPYYGFAPIKIADVINKYIQVKLDIDLPTGQAVYTIMVSQNSIPRIPKCKYWVYSSADNPPYIRVLGTYVFQLGSPVPFGTTGMVDNIRNTLSTVVKFAGATLTMGADFGAGMAAMGSVASSGSSTPALPPSNKAIVPAAGGAIVRSNEKIPINIDYPDMGGVTHYETTMEVPPISLSNFMLTPSCDKPNNSLLGLTSEREIVLVVRYAKIVTDDYSKLYGLPYGKAVKLNTVGGYTEISRIHIEGLDKATARETAMVANLLAQGVILPDPAT